jgi:hypothetical protein
MQLRVKFTDDSIIIYREKWGAIFTQLAVAIVCVSIAAVFYYLGASKAPPVFLIIFCGMFSLAGVAMLATLPRRAKQILANDGAQIMVANPTGISVAPYFGSAAKYNVWGSLSELILTEKLQITESHADDNSLLRHQLIVMFTADAHKKEHWLNEFGSGITKSGEGRAYLCFDYPKKYRNEICLALKRLVPSNVAIRICTKVEFNRKLGKDNW